MKKTSVVRKEDVVRSWHLVDAKGQAVGRISSEIVGLLMGKHKRDYTLHTEMGDNVVVVNASSLEFSGRKLKQKVYYKHSGYPSGFSDVKLSKLMDEKPERVVELAVKRMLPDNRLRDARMSRLHVFSGSKHDYSDKFKRGESKK